MGVSNRFRTIFKGAAACVLLLASAALAKSHREYPFKYSDVDMPMLLAVGTVRMPEFPATAQWYDIMIQVDKPLPFQRMACMMGVTLGPLDRKECRSSDPLLQADWTVWIGENIIDRGSIPNRCACVFTDKHIYKLLGSFPGEAGKKYGVEVTFTKDRSPLNVANPRLFVIQHRYMW